MASDADVHDRHQPRHLRTKSSVLSSFVQRLQPSAPSSPTRQTFGQGHYDTPSSFLDDAMAVGQFVKNNPGALGELQQNSQESAPRSPRKSHEESRDDARGRSKSPTKNTLANISLKNIPGRETFSRAKSREPSPTKHQKTKSGTNLVGLLSRPKSSKNLQKLATEDHTSLSKDKENQTPIEPVSPGLPPPIFAQFTSGSSLRQDRGGSASLDIAREPQEKPTPPLTRPVVRERPKSFQVPPPYSNHESRNSFFSSRITSADSAPAGSSVKDASNTKSRRPKVFTAFSSRHHVRSKSAASSPTASSSELSLDLRDIDKHLEAMLDRRNIPENQRYKMRNLNDTIKMEFIRQDWAEMQAARAERVGSTDSPRSNNDINSAIADGSDCEDVKQKKTRGKSFTFSRNKKGSNSPTKKQKGEGTLGRHFRSKSTESIASERPSSSGSSVPNLFAKMKMQQGPGDYVAYLRKVQKPELVEVGKLHKLRLLLRNETVSWIEEFIQQGGMKEIVGLLNRIMEVEWREEHEDALLHENLSCLKALSTTARAMQYLHTIQKDLFPKLLHMLFDPEKKGPSEFTTRNIVTSILFTYIESAPPTERPTRARDVLNHLRDPEGKEEERPVPFVLEMRQQRPYRVWCKEVVSVTKEVFWIFLHNLNVVALPSKNDQMAGASTTAFGDDPGLAYMTRHFPPERPPVPAAPYVGGVEWDATNYLASHLDLMNAILACTPLCSERNKLRAEFRISGWERCLGGSMRLCKEKFYGNVHNGLRTWVAAAADDNWDVRDVRYGPPVEARSPVRKIGGGQKKKVEEPPRIDMPKLDFELDKPQALKDAWLS